MYTPVPKVPDFPALERRLLRWWAERNTFDQLREKNANGKPWSFLDGPITANNPMGVHHAWGRSYKDMFQRYHAMCGRRLRYQNGFDCQGLWVEVEVEKSLGFETKADIEAYGIDNFVRACKERVLTYAAIQTEQSVRLGYWMDWDDPENLRRLRDALGDGREQVTITAPTGEQVTDHPERIVGALGSAKLGGSYFTFSDENNYTIWSFLKKCHDEGFVYRGHDVMPWCCRCGTGLSQMEVAEGRKITRHLSVFVRFPLQGRDKEALLVWTTTPWTLTSNVAAAVNPEMTYLKVRHGEWTYYIGKGNFEKDRLRSLEAAGKQEKHKLPSIKKILKGTKKPVEVLGEVRGAELVGLAYHGPFDHLDAQSAPGGLPATDSLETGISGHRVLAWDVVSEDEGSGIVHIAPGCGAEDARLGAEVGLVAIAPLAEDGTYVAGFGPWTGRQVHGVAREISEDLAARDLLVARESYPHVYPHCWRCKEELVFRLVDEWFIRMDWRDRIKKIVPEIRWIPADGEARELDWLKNMGDWMISKKRYWGLALPIWVCQACDSFTVIGSREELQERAVAGWEDFEGHAPHRPHVDKVQIACASCGARAERIKDVGNPWLDAGIVPYSTLSYSTDRAHWEEWFPADFVVECFPGQFRNWFYALLSMSAMMTGRAPFQVLLGHAMVRDARGEEMHKSKGNSIPFNEAADHLGAEVMRYLYAGQKPTQNLSFPDLGANDRKGIDAEIRRKLLTFWNCYSFFIRYATVDGWTPGETPAALSELDLWIRSRLQRMIRTAHAAFADYSLYRLVERFEQFTDELSNWYLRRSRRRFWKSDTDTDKLAAYHTLYTVLTTVNRLMAPIMPFLTEEIYQNLVRAVDDAAPESVHLTDYPQVDTAALDDALEARIAAVIRTKNHGLRLRQRANIKVRQPLSALIVRPASASDRAVLADARYARQVLEECNLKEIRLIEDESDIATVTIKPNFKALGPRYGRYMKAIAAHIAATAAADIIQGIDGGGYTFTTSGEVITLGRGDVQVVLQTPAHLVADLELGTFAALDVTITAALEAEGLAREFNRQAQDMRKKLDLAMTDRIAVRFASTERIAAAVAAHAELLAAELLADSIERVDTIEGAETVRISGEPLALLITVAG